VGVGLLAVWGVAGAVAGPVVSYMVTGLIMLHFCTRGKGASRNELGETGAA